MIDRCLSCLTVFLNKLCLDWWLTILARSALLRDGGELTIQLTRLSMTRIIEGIQKGVITLMITLVHALIEVLIKAFLELRNLVLDRTH